MNTNEQMQWKMNIIKWAYELGFVSIGFTSAEPIDGLAPLLHTRIAQGLETPFESKEIERRIDPKAGWPPCQTIAALAYPLPYSSSSRQGEGIIARSAVGEDYHRIVNKKINSLVEKMAGNGWQGSSRWQVDTGPLVERAFALRAGIGWIGRNQNLIIPACGSFVTLALLLLDQELVPDHSSITNQCGTCQICVQVCPAQILGKEPFAAKHCVSYLTQSKELLKPEEGEQLGLRIFGCDTCQEVCPYNQQRIQEEGASSFSLRRGVDLLDTLNLTKGEFQSRYESTAAGWRRKGILQRNAFLAMCNLPDERYKLWLEQKENARSIPKFVSPYIISK
jgi:epoxyqueuosine reductase